MSLSTLWHSSVADSVSSACSFSVSVSSAAGSASDFSASGSFASSSSAAGSASGSSAGGSVSGSSAPNASASGSYASGSFALLHPKQLVLGTNKGAYRQTIKAQLTLTKYLSSNNNNCNK